MLRHPPHFAFTAFALLILAGFALLFPARAAVS